MGLAPIKDERRKWEQEQVGESQLGAGLTPGKGEGEGWRSGRKSLSLQCSLETPWPRSWGALGPAGVVAPAPAVLSPQPLCAAVLDPEGTEAAGCQPTTFLPASPLVEGT